MRGSSLNLSSVSRPPKPLCLGGERQVVPGAVVLEQDPGLPFGGQPALGARGDQLGGGIAHFLPGLGRRVGIEPGFLEQVLVPVEDRRGGVERHRQQLAVGRRVVAVHRADEGLGIERLLLVLHQLVDRIDRALGRHHGRGADLEHLHDVRRLLGAEGGDRRRHGLAVGALEDGVDLVFGLGLVELRRSWPRPPRPARRPWRATTGFRSARRRRGRSPAPQAAATDDSRMRDMTISLPETAPSMYRRGARLQCVCYVSVR